MLKLYNTLTRKKEDFKPLHERQVGLYTCGPTVYNFVHIGNLRAYIFEDTLTRALKHNGYTVNHVMNITDVGHLTDDADNGEDKMEKGSAREGKSAWDIAEFYTKMFKEDLKQLNILEPSLWCKATEHIPEQIEQVQTLIDKGYAYETSDGIYFDTTKLEDYGKLAQLEKQELKAGARVELGEKKNLHDFALWKFTKQGETRQMEWEAFGKKGFPGWHIECSAMSIKYLGTQFDIHCGGIDHISVHHTNEIAQAEAATGIKPWVQFWLHGEFLLIDGGKMAKSGENFITLQSILDKNYSPLAYRYFLLQAHYRTQLSFSWEALEAAEHGLERLRHKVSQIPERAPSDPHLHHEFMDAINDDLNTPAALGILWNAVKEGNISMPLIIEFDKILGLDLHELLKEAPIPTTPELEELLNLRMTARESKNWLESDRLRDVINDLGYIVKDTPAGQQLTKKKRTHE